MKFLAQRSRFQSPFRLEQPKRSAGLTTHARIGRARLCLAVNSVLESKDGQRNCHCTHSLSRTTSSTSMLIKALFFENGGLVPEGEVKRWLERLNSFESKASVTLSKIL